MRIEFDVERANLAAIGVAGVVDQHVHAAHLRRAQIDGAGVVGVLADVGDESDGARLHRHLLDGVGVAPGEDHGVASLTGLGDERGADALAAAGDQESLRLHQSGLPMRPRHGASSVKSMRRRTRNRPRPRSVAESPPGESPMKTLVTVAVVLLVVGQVPSAQSSRLATAEHKLSVTSTVPAIAGQTVEIYVRERFLGDAPPTSLAPNHVVLFVHGAGTPAEVAFDVPHADYSWMAYLANAGFDVFAMDTTGYGRSVRPAAMNDPCNLSPEQQKAFVPALIPAPCPATYPGQLTTIASDWNDIDAVVDHIRALRKVEKVSLVAWSLGGPRAGGYAAQHPDKVHRLVLLAPAYNREAKSEPPPLPNPGAGVQHPVTRRVRRQLGSPGGLPQPGRSGRAGDGVEGDAGVRSGRRQVGPWRTPRAVHDQLGLERRRDRRHQGADADDCRGARQAGAGRARPGGVCGSRGQRQGPARPRLLLPQRDVGSQPPADVQGVARLADQGHGRRAHAAAWSSSATRSPERS